MRPDPDFTPSRAAALRIAAAYAVIGVLWILGSGWALHSVVSDAAWLATLEAVKGWFYVLVTAGLLGWWLDRYFREIRHAAEQIRRSESRFQSIFQNNPEAVGISRLRDGVFVDANDAFVWLCGCPREEIIGRTAEQLALWPSGRHAELTAELQAKLRVTADLQIRRRNGEGRDLLAALQRIELAGEPCLLETLVDVSERRRAERALHESEARLRLLGDNLPDGVVYQRWRHPDGRHGFRHMSAGIERILGVPAERVMADPESFLELVLEPKRLAAAEQVSARDLTVFDCEFRQCTVTGRVKWIHARSMPRQLADGSIVWDGVASDITERKHAEEALRRSATHLRTLVNILPDLVWLKDPRGVYLGCNARFESFFGATQAEIVGRTDYDFMKRELADFFRANDAAAIAAGGPRVNEEEVTFASDGHRELLETIKAPMVDADGVLVGVLGIARDITARRQAEQALRASAAALVEAQRIAGVGNWEWDLRQDRHTWSEEVYRIYGRDPALPPAVYPEVSQYFTPESWARLSAAVKRGMEEGTAYECDAEVIRADGTHRWITARGEAERDGSGSTTCLRGTVQDITARKRTELAWQESEGRFRALVETTFDWVWEVDATDCYTYVSPRVRDLLGYSPAEVLGRTPFDLMPEAEAQRVRILFHQIVGRREPFSALENINRHQSGRMVVLEKTGVPVFDADGQFKGYRGMDRDVTERKQAEQALRREAERLIAILDAQREIAGANLDHAGLIQLILTSVGRLAGADGASLEVAEGDEMAYVATTGMAAPFVGLRLKMDASLSGTCLRSGEFVRVEDAEIHPGVDRAACRRIGLRSMVLLPLRYGQDFLGVLKLMSARVAAFSADVEPTLRLMSEFLGATIARKQTEAELRQQKHELQMRNEQLERFNRATVGRELRMIELKQEVEALCRAAGLPERYPRGDPAVVEQTGAVARAAADGPREAQAAMLNLVEDATVARDRAEQVNGALRESEARRSFALEAAHAGTWEWDLVTGENVWSEELWKLYGLAPHSCEPSYEAWRETVHPEDRARLEQTLQETVRQEAGLSLEWRVNSSAGEPRWLMSRGRPLRNDAGRVTRYLGVVIDITVRKRAEEAARQNEARLNFALQASNTGAWSFGLQDRTATRTLIHAQIFGYATTDSPWDTEKFFSHLLPEDRPMVEERIRTGIASRSGWSFECRIRRTDGQVRWLFIAGGFEQTSGTPRVHGIVQDITDRRLLEQQRTAMEAQLRQQQKLESIGTLASGVAHEINNPITGIMNYAQLIQDRLPEPSPLTEFSGEILHEARRVATIVRNLLTFARNERQTHSPARLDAIVEAVLSLVRTVIRRDQILLTVSLPSELPPLKCRSQQIQQVIMNLVTNARDALNERYPGAHPDKVLLLSARLREDAGRRWIRLTVEDHGTGIAPEVRERMFDPFYTTKGRDAGTGLGLSISHGIVKEHHGEWTVETEPGAFTRMHVDLPVDNGWEL